MTSVYLSLPSPFPHVSPHGDFDPHGIPIPERSYSVDYIQKSPNGENLNFFPIPQATVSPINNLSNQSKNHKTASSFHTFV